MKNTEGTKSSLPSIISQLHLCDSCSMVRTASVVQYMVDGQLACFWDVSSVKTKFGIFLNVLFGVFYFCKLMDELVDKCNKAVESDNVDWINETGCKVRCDSDIISIAGMDV